MECIIRYNKPVCSFCNEETNTSLDNGFIQCNHCGLVFEHTIEISAETSQGGFANPDEKRNTFSTSGTIDQLLPQSSMSSYLVGKGHNSVKRLQMWGRVPTKERSLLLVFERIKQALQRSTIDSKVLNDSKIIYHNLYMRSQTEFNKKNVLSRGLNRDGLIAYIVFIACEENSILINKTNICELFNITDTVFKAGKRKYHDLMIKKETTSSTIRYTLTDYMGRFLAMLPFTPDERKMCFVVTKRIEQIKIMKNKQPVSAAAGLIYFMAQFYKKEDITRQYISKISEKSEPTILKIATVLNDYKFYILPKNLL